MFVRILGLLRGTLFFSCYLLSIRMVFISIDHAPINWFFICVLELVVGIAGLWKTRMAIFGLVGMLPIISGVQMLGFLNPVPLMSLIFSSLYIVWLPKRLFYRREDLNPKTLIGNLVDIFSGLILLSLTITLWRYPNDMIFYHFWYGLAGSQKDTFYCIDAAWVLLQGIFLYRMIELEMNNHFSLRSVLPVFYFQAPVIVFFSVLQLIIKNPAPWGGFALYAPFDDIHSYGSYLALLFFTYLTLLDEGPLTAKLYQGICFGFIILLIILSFSRTTWVSVLIIGFVFTIHKYSARKKILFLVCSSILFVLFWVSPLSDILKQSDGAYIKRVGQFLTIKDLLGDPARISLLKRALNIISDFPVTGSGIGTFYRISIFYQDLRVDEFKDYYENAHNYFLQLAAESGLPGLLLFLFILFLTYRAGFRGLTSSKETSPLIKGLLFGLSAYLITCFTGHPLLSLNQQFLFWFAISTIGVPQNFVKGSQSVTGGARKVSVLISILAIAIVLVTSNDFMKDRKSEESQSYEYGFYPYELWNGKKIRWIGWKAVTKTRVQGDVIVIEVFATPNNIGPDGLDLNLFLDGKLLDHIHFVRSEARRLQYIIRNKKNELIEIKFAVNKTFNPRRLGINQDSRNLGVVIGEIQFANKVEAP